MPWDVRKDGSREDRMMKHDEQNPKVKTDSWCSRCGRQVTKRLVGPMEWKCDNCGHISGFG